MVHGLRLLQVNLMNLEQQLRGTSGQQGVFVDPGAMAEALGALKGDAFPTACVKAIQAFLKHETFAKRSTVLMHRLIEYACMAVLGPKFYPPSLGSACTPAGALAEAAFLREAYGDPPITARVFEIQRVIEGSDSDKLRVLRVYSLLAAGSCAPQGEPPKVDQHGKVTGRRNARPPLDEPLTRRLEALLASANSGATVVTTGPVAATTWPTSNTARRKASIRPKNSKTK